MVITGLKVFGLTPKSTPHICADWRTGAETFPMKASI
jgi:hypothetical protein